jgi:fatty acid desaturase
MTLEVILIIAGVVGLAAAFVFFALARRVVRLAIRLIVVLVVIFVVIVTALIFAWYGTGDKKPSQQQNRSTNSRRSNSR